MVATDALRSVFKCFDIDHSGGISVTELQSAMKVLGVPCSDAKARQMFAEVDNDGSGEIDFAEFCAVVEKGDGGALARLIEKVAADQRVREIMKERIRPIEKGSGAMCVNEMNDFYVGQLARLHEERKWMSGLHMTSAHEIEKAARHGYTSDVSTYVSLDAVEHGKKGPPPPSPTQVAELKLNSARTTRCMLPDIGAVPPSASPSSARSSGLGLRRVFHVQGALPGRSISQHTSPITRRPSGGNPLNSPRERRGIAELAHADDPWDSPRHHSVPAYRPPAAPSFHAAGVQPSPSRARALF